MDYPLVFTSLVDVGSNIPPNKATGVSCLAFDTEQEILWTGNYSGHITSFVPNSSTFSPGRYTSFHVDHESDVRQIGTCKEGVLSITKNALRFSKRRGVTKFTHKSENLLRDLRCMLYRNMGESKIGNVLLAGNQEKLIELDIETRQHVRRVDIYENDDAGLRNCYYMKGHPKFICMADCEGKIVLRDVDMLQIQHEFQPTAPISSFDACGNYLVTCSQYSQLLMIYDVREMKLVSATQAYMPAHIKFLSRFTTKCCIVSRNGQFKIVDLTCPNNVHPFNSINIHSYGAEITAFDVSATDQAFAFGDSHNGVYVHGTCEKFHINTNPQQPECADALLNNSYYPLVADMYPPISEISPFPYFAFTSATELRRLASYMPPSQCIKTYRHIPPIAPDILNSMRIVGNIGYVVNPSGQFSLVNNYAHNGSASRRNSPEGNEFGTDQMPHRYHFLEPNHNKVDKDEYDFSRYNQSPFPGLDSTLPNSYSNNMIQCIYFIPPLRASIVSHVCDKEYCLVCELGFLFHMLDIASKHSPCQASNFFRAFRTIPEVAAFKLILPDDESLRKQTNFFKLTQQWLRFLLHQLHRESSAKSNSEQNESKNSFINELFSLELIRQVQCCKCNNVWKTPHSSFPVTLNFPNNHSFQSSNGSQSGSEHSSDNKGKYYTFVDLLLSSILTEQTIQAMCEKCNKFHNVTERRLVSSLPKLFAINTGLDNEMAIKFWQDQVDAFNVRNQSPGKNVITNIQKLSRSARKNDQQKKQTNKTISCKFGSNCKRNNCKFYHKHLDPQADMEGENSMVSWIPLTLYIWNNEDGSFDIKDSLKGGNLFEKEKYIEYSLVNVTSVVKSSEETFGNIVSAVKIDKCYFEARKKQIIKRWKRQNARLPNQGDDEKLQQYLCDMGHDGDVFDDDYTGEEHDFFTLDSRNPVEFDKDIPKHDSNNEWYLFNHYSINPIDVEEVVSNDLSWKIPTILTYARKDLSSSYDFELMRQKKNIINSNVFRDIMSDVQKMQIKSYLFYPLDLQNEMPKRGDIVAMDAEFVMLNHEETELRSDGTRTTIKPSHKSVARISCVRGSGPMQGVPFIDDYISTQDQVADYMTKFSGIQPGDLDASLSSKHLTTLKSTYFKLRFLIDNGVIFVGHGLRNDFRVINVVVPPEQVIDTVYLFQSPNSKRMVSLRFLAWHFMNLNIQSETHDSVEDAKTALSLYHKFKELEQSGCAQEAIEKLYKVGKDCNWKVSDY